MKHSLDPRAIVRCTFSPHRVDGERKLSVADLLLYLVLPAVLGVAGAWVVGSIQEPYLTTVISVYAILAAVLMSLLPLIYSIVGQAETRRRFSIGERVLAKHEINRLATLQDLYAVICYNIFILVLALFCCIALVFVVKQVPLVNGEFVEPSAGVLLWLMRIFSAVVYFVGVSTALCVLNVGNGVFDAMEDQVRSAREQIECNTEEEEE